MTYDTILLGIQIVMFAAAVIAFMGIVFGTDHIKSYFRGMKINIFRKATSKFKSTQPKTFPAGIELAK